MSSSKSSSWWTRWWPRTGATSPKVTPLENIQGALQDREAPDAMRLLQKHCLSEWERLPSGEHFLDWLLSDVATKTMTSSRDILKVALVAMGRGAKIPSKATAHALAHQSLISGYKNLDFYQELVAGGYLPFDKQVKAASFLMSTLMQHHHLLALELLNHPLPPYSCSNGSHTFLHALALSTEESSSSLRHDQDLDGDDWGNEVPHDDARYVEPDVLLKRLADRLLAVGVDLNAVNPQGQTAYSLGDFAFRNLLAGYPGLQRTGLNQKGQTLAYEAVALGSVWSAKALMETNPEAFTLAGDHGGLAAWGWWDINNPTESVQLLQWLKQERLWLPALQHTDEAGRGFLTYGLHQASQDKKSLKALDWKLARLETELPPKMWSDPDVSGETLNFWLTSLKCEDLLHKYVLPHRQAMLMASFERAKDVTDTIAPRPRF